MRGWESDLVVLVPDKNIEAAMLGILSRPEALGIRSIESTVFVHPDRDPGCLLRAHEFLRSMTARFAYGLVLFDRDGCGREGQGREALEEEVTRKLAAAGWDDRAAVIVIDPELEVWVWSDSPHVEDCLGWRGRQPHLRDWLASRDLWPAHELKPSDPKQATDHALREVRRPRSSALYAELAGRVSFDRCSDGAFVDLREVLANWFAPASR